MRNMSIVLSMLLLAHCGGSSGSGIIVLSGSWTGFLRQVSGLSCSDGSSLGGGAGTTSPNESTIRIVGADTLGESGTLEIGSCSYPGTRVSETTAEFSSEEPPCFEKITVEVLNSSSFEAFFDPATPVPLEDGTPTCVAFSDGTFSRG